jgi:hypothetical protein
MSDLKDRFLTLLIAHHPLVMRGIDVEVRAYLFYNDLRIVHAGGADVLSLTPAAASRGGRGLADR